MFFFLWIKCLILIYMRRWILLRMAENKQREQFLHKWKQLAVTEYQADKKQIWANTVREAAVY